MDCTKLKKESEIAYALARRAGWGDMKMTRKVAPGLYLIVGTEHKGLIAFEPTMKADPSNRKEIKKFRPDIFDAVIYEKPVESSNIGFYRQPATGERGQKYVILEDTDMALVALLFGDDVAVAVTPRLDRELALYRAYGTLRRWHNYLPMVKEIKPPVLASSV